MSSSNSHLLLIGGVSLAAFVVFQLINATLLYIHRWKVAKENGCKPPRRYPHKEPILGYDFFQQSKNAARSSQFLETVQNRYFHFPGSPTPVYTFSWLMLGKENINTIEPENIKTILATKFKDWSLGQRRYDAFHPLVGDGIFNSNGAQWEKSRSMLRPNFNRSQVGDLDTFEEHIGHLIARVPKNGDTVDMQELFFLLTIDSASEFLLGTSTNTLLGPGDANFAEAFNRSQEKIGIRFRVGQLFSLFPDKQFQSDCKTVHEFFDYYVDQIVALTEKYKYLPDSEKKVVEGARYVFANELAKKGHSARKIRDELLNVMLAGRDTTASLLSNLFFTLARRPEIFAKLRAEVLTLGGERPTFEQIKDLKYLKACLSEALRVYPVIANNQRTAVKDTILPTGGGPDGKSPMLIKAGTAVHYHLYSMHRRPDFFGPDAEEFKPERWETLNPKWEYLPFNGGPRICIGQQFALTEASYTTIRIVQAFKAIEPREDRPWRELVSLATAVGGGVKVAMTPA